MTGCKLTAVRHHPVFKAFPSKAALLVVLALQLVLGLQLLVAPRIDELIRPPIA
jgi:hypothetical protein